MRKNTELLKQQYNQEMPMNMDGEVGQVWDLWIIRTDCFKQV